MNEEEEELKLKLRLLTINYMYLSHRYETLENIFKGITSKECLGLLEEKTAINAANDGFLNNLLLAYISQQDEHLQMIDENTKDSVSKISNVLIEFNKILTQKSP